MSIAASNPRQTETALYRVCALLINCAHRSPELTEAFILAADAQDSSAWRDAPEYATLVDKLEKQS